MESAAVVIGNSYIEMCGGDVVEAVRQHGDSSTDILVAYIAMADPELGKRLGRVVG